MEHESQTAASAVSQTRTQITEEQLSHDKQQEGMSFHACFSSQGDGQCFCKANVCGQLCSACRDGYFNMENANYFGCQGEPLLWCV